MKKYWQSILLGILFALLSNMVVYNYKVIVYYALKLNVDSIQYVSVVRFLLFYFFTFFLYKKIPFRSAFIQVSLPVFLLDATTLILGKELVPLRFPFDTIYPILGNLLALVWIHAKPLATVFSSLACLLFIFFSEKLIRLKLLWMVHENMVRAIPVSNQERMLRDTFIGLDKKKLVLGDTLLSKVKLVEFYFVGCLPCEEKRPVLKEINQLQQNQDFRIAMICDGTITKFENFYADAMKEPFNDFIYLYDTSNIRKYNLTGFPTEFLFKQKSLINVDVGFGNAIAAKWKEKELELIHNALQEKQAD